MRAEASTSKELFDDWPSRYNQWFETPIGKLVQHYEAELLQDMLDPRDEDFILDAGCGTGIFTTDILASGACVVGIDISMPMIVSAAGRFISLHFSPVAGDMLHLPFTAGSFDKVYSMTALEFVENGRRAVAELQRVTKIGGTIVLTTLNRLSPWAERRLNKADAGHELFKSIVFRSPEEMRRLVPAGARLKTAIHFQKDDEVVRARQIEAEGQADGRETGAFLAVCWKNN